MIIQLYRTITHCSFFWVRFKDNNALATCSPVPCTFFFLLKLGFRKHESLSLPHTRNPHSSAASLCSASIRNSKPYGSSGSVEEEHGYRCSGWTGSSGLFWSAGPCRHDGRCWSAGSFAFPCLDCCYTGAKYSAYWLFGVVLVWSQK